MNRIDAVFQKTGHTSLVTYVTVGYPDIESTLRVVPLLAENGCDIIELGIPFSDPLADGVTIQAASYKALQNGVTPRKCLEVASELRKKVDAPLIFMTYYNPVFNYGPDKFCKDCAAAGIDGLIIPDLIPEEGADMGINALKYELDLIYLLPPTATDERVKMVGDNSSGFVYLVSVTGITGARDMLPSGLESFVKRVRNQVDIPLCVGFGISTPEQAGQVASIADGVIVGSRIIQLMDEDKSLKKVAEFTGELRKAIDRS